MEAKKMIRIEVKLPLGWQNLIDEAREDMPLDEWIQMLVRDALIDAGKWPRAN